MAGHNKWSKVKNIKGVVDAKRSKIFSKLSKEITIAAKNGGGDISTNPRLRQSIDNAKSNNMPKDNIERAVKKGTGELEGISLEEILYEGFAPGGIGFILETVTDNKNRTVAEIRTIFSKNNGNLGNAGSVTFLFDRLGEITIPKDQCNEEELFDIVIESNALDMITSEDTYSIFTKADKLAEISNFIANKNISTKNQQLVYHPKNKIEITNVDQAKNLLNLIDKLEDQDDTQNIYTNLDISNEIISKINDI